MVSWYYVDVPSFHKKSLNITLIWEVLAHSAEAANGQDF